MTSPLRGVNLGGWLVLEKWITPRVFADTAAVDEYTFATQADDALRTRLRRHHATFITERDFRLLAAQGIEAVRLPVGYWLFGDRAPFMSTVEYVDKAFTWAEACGLQVLLDLHAAPGSQNGNDHSGRKGKIRWHQDAQSIQMTLDAITKLAQRYGDSPALLGISVLNEPSSGIPHAQLVEFYAAAHAVIRQYCDETTWIVFSDSFQPRQWEVDLSPAEFPGMYIDHHQYQIFTPQDARLPGWLQVLRARFLLSVKLRRIARHHPLVIGEWSLALSQTALKSSTTQQQNRIATAYGRAQLRAYQCAAAWFFWTYKTESAKLWSFERCAAEGLVPDFSGHV